MLKQFVVFYRNVCFLKAKISSTFLQIEFIFQAVINPFKSCSRLTLNIKLIKQKICHDVVLCFVMF